MFTLILITSSLIKLMLEKFTKSSVIVTTGGSFIGLTVIEMGIVLITTSPVFTLLLSNLSAVS